MSQLFPAGLSGIRREQKDSLIEKRALGKTGVMLSMIGFGGIVVDRASSEEASRRVKQAIDRGINYFDVAPTYGNAEAMLGPALEPYRKDVFLACKTMERDREGSRRELERSLEYLRTDHFDLYQFHSVITLEEVEQIFAPGGAMETFREAQQEGKIRFIGFSAHSEEAAMAMMDRHDFDTILFPYNFATRYAGNFGPRVLQRALEKNLGILALKSMAWRPWKDGEEQTTDGKTWYAPLPDSETARQGLYFTLSHPVTAAIPPGHEDLFAMALELAAEFKPLNEGEIRKLEEKAMQTTPIFKYPHAD